MQDHPERSSAAAQAALSSASAGFLHPFWGEIQATWRRFPQDCGFQGAAAGEGLTKKAFLGRNGRTKSRDLMTLLGISGWARLLTVMLLFAVSAQASAAAQGDPAYLAEYKAYSAAIDAGDREAAVRHSYAAWQDAEEALGDHELTGILAFNYGQLVIFTDAKNARSALKRAKKLAEAGAVDLPSADLELFHAYVEFAANKQRNFQAGNLHSALLDIEETGIVNADIAVMWLHLAASYFKKEQYPDALDTATKSEHAFEASAPENHSQRANAIIIAGASKLIPFPRKLDDVIAAHEDFSRAVRLFPPQKDFESFDPVLAQAHGWFAAADAAIGSMGEDHKETVPRGKGPTPPMFEQSPAPSAGCGSQWDERLPPKYPSAANRRGYIGAVIAVYDLGDDLSVHNPRILVEVPVETFSKTVLKSMEKWTLKTPPADHPACRDNRTTQFTFVLTE